MVDKPPAAIKANDTHHQSFKDFDEPVRRTSGGAWHLHDAIQETINMNKNVWSSLISHAEHVLNTLGRFIARMDQTMAVQNKLIKGIVKKHNPEHRKQEQLI